MNNHFPLFEDKMKKAGIYQIVITSFKYLYDKLAAGTSGKLSCREIDKPRSERITNYSELPDGKKADWEKLAVIKLNGGLGTSMGLERAKSLLKVKGDNTFLDIISRQIIHQRKATGTPIPLLLMNSFNTSADTLNYLKKYDDLIVSGLPLDFLQNKFPKVKKNDLKPLENSNDLKNWNPPGHGEIYMVLKQTGLLDKLLEQGYRYLFISNSDNLGAVADGRILQYMHENKLPFIMEVCSRTEMDKKGGHLAEDKNGKLILRESAQCPQEEIAHFQDINFYKYFNTNNLWVDLDSLAQKLAENNNYLNLNPIMNHKEVDGVEVIQLETAMGSAINLFDDSRAIVVNRDRFVPVKKTNEFLAVRSDAYLLDDNWRITLQPGKDKAPQIELDEEYYQTINDFEEKFLGGYPSLRDCESLHIRGNIHFGKNVSFSGKVRLSNAESKLFIENKVFDNVAIQW